MNMINLNRREKLFVGGAGVFIVLFVLFQLLIQPVFEKRDELRRKLSTKRETVQQMRAMQAEYLSLVQKSQQSQNRFKRRPAGFTLFSFMDRLAGDTGLKENITYMKPSASVDETTGLKISYVELKLQDVPLEDLTSYLFRVETSENMVRVNRLSISKTGEDEGLLSVVMQVETVESSTP